MKILMISLDFLPTVGGITAHVYGLSKALIELGHDVVVLTRQVRDKPKEETIDGIKIKRISLGGIGFLYGEVIRRRVIALLNEESFDLVHIHGLRPLEFYNIKQVPLVFTNHTSGFLKRIQKGGWRVKLLQKLFQKPDLILAPSKELLQFPFEVQAKTFYIPNGIWIEKYKRNEQMRQQIRKELGIKDEYLGIVTRRMVYKNGVSILARSLRYIKNRNFKLLFIGDGEEFGKVKKVLQEIFEGRYILLGSLPHKKIVPYYSAADFAILPSLMEATSISGLEAMAASLPLVGTRVGGIPDLVEEGVNGYLCEPNDPVDLAEAIEKLLAQNMKQMGERSYRKVQNFDWMQIAKQTIAAYREVL